MFPTDSEIDILCEAVALSEMDYPEAQVRFVIKHWELINELKFRITSNLILDVFTGSNSAQWYLQEHQTLIDKSPKTTRVPKNSNRITERLSDLMCDISLARQFALSPAEDMVLMLGLADSGFPVSRESLDSAEESLAKVVAWLNRE